MDIEEPVPDLQLAVAIYPARSAPLCVMHPCRCDAPDPEAARMEPLAVPLATLVADGHALVICPECEYRVLVLLRPHVPASGS